MRLQVKIMIAVLTVLIIIILAWAGGRLVFSKSNDKEEYYGAFLPWQTAFTNMNAISPIHVSAPLARYFWLYRYPYSPYFH